MYILPILMYILPIPHFVKEREDVMEKFLYGTALSNVNAIAFHIKLPFKDF